MNSDKPEARVTIPINPEPEDVKLTVEPEAKDSEETFTLENAEDHSATTRQR